MEAQYNKRYIAVDANGDIFIFQNRPFRCQHGSTKYWTCEGEEDAIFRDGLITSFGRILGFDDPSFLNIFKMGYTDEPLEIKINIAKNESSST